MKIDDFNERGRTEKEKTVDKGVLDYYISMTGPWHMHTLN